MNLIHVWIVANSSEQNHLFYRIWKKEKWNTREYILTISGEG